MRTSDQKLHDALKNVGFDDLAERAANSEWNDFFGDHAMPQHHLTAVIQQRFFAAIEEAYSGKSEPDKAAVKQANLINSVTVRVMAGEFDGTPQESQEWAESEEGKQTFGEFGLATAPDGQGGTQLVPSDQLKQQAEGDASDPRATDEEE